MPTYPLYMTLSRDITEKATQKRDFNYLLTLFMCNASYKTSILLVQV